jgi:hypothetical protein
MGMKTSDIAAIVFDTTPIRASGDLRPGVTVLQTVPRS